MSKLMYYRWVAVFIFAAVFTACDSSSGTMKFKTFEIAEGKLKEVDEAYYGFRCEVSFLYPTQYSDKAVLEKLQRKFIQYTLGEEQVNLSPDKAIEACIAKYKIAYAKELENLRSINSDPGFEIGWRVFESNAILFMNNALLQMECKGRLVPYAAHIFETSTYHLFNLQTGDEYTRNDIFKPEAAETIRRTVIVPELLKDDNFSKANVPRYNLWTEKTVFAITGEGILIFYEESDLNDDIMGNHTITIPYAKILPYLREGTPVWEVANKKRVTPQQADEQKKAQDLTGSPQQADVQERAQDLAGSPQQADERNNERDAMEAKIGEDILALPEMQFPNAAVVMVRTPTDNQPYYEIKGGSNMDDHFATSFWFRVYVEPTYEIKVYDIVTVTAHYQSFWIASLCSQ